MARKVFFSILGTGFYGACRYVDEAKDFESSQTRFIQCATLQYIKASEWTESDAIIIALTDSAKSTNWSLVPPKRKNFVSGIEEEYVGLMDRIAELDLPCSVKELPIPDGKNENEMWQIFTSIFNSLEHGDELYIDLTHSFRYLPMLLLVLADYARLIKDVKVMGVTYGNWEARKADPNGMNNAPIVDLMPLIALQNWTTATYELINDGNAKAVSEAAKYSLLSLLRDKDCSREIRDLNQATKELKEWIEQIRTCRGKEILMPDKLFSFVGKLSSISNDAFPPLMPILDKIRQSFENVGFKDEETINNLYAASKWCVEMNLWQSAITLLQEAIISKLCLITNLEIKLKSDREIASNALNRIIKEKINPGNNTTENKEPKCNIENKDGQGEEKDIYENTTVLLRNNKLVTDDFCKLYSRISELRNDFNHSGMRKSNSNSTKITNNIKVYVQECSGYFDANEIQHHNQAARIFINLSNHPSAKWSEGQLEAAKQYGEVIDIDFPSVDSMADEALLDELVNHYVNKILYISNGKEATVHVMGEMTFTYRLVCALKEYGIKCVASTTERISHDNGDGTKTSEFKFIKLRSY